MENKIKDFLDQQPLQISILNGDEYIKIGHVEEDLDELVSKGYRDANGHNSSHWDAKDFHFQLSQIGDRICVTASLQLQVVIFIGKYDYVKINRPGAASFFVNGKEENTNYAATAKSLALKNAARTLGNKFGRWLNDRSRDAEDFPEKEEKDISVSEEVATNIVKNIKI